MSETQSSPSNLNLSTSTNQTDSASNSFNNKSWVLQSSFLKKEYKVLKIGLNPIGRRHLEESDSKRLKISRVQLEFHLSPEGNISVKRLGINPSYLYVPNQESTSKSNSVDEDELILLEKDKSYSLSSGAIIFLLKNTYGIEIKQESTTSLPSLALTKSLSSISVSSNVEICNSKENHYSSSQTDETASLQNYSTYSSRRTSISQRRRSQTLNLDNLSPLKAKLLKYSNYGRSSALGKALGGSQDSISFPILPGFSLHGTKVMEYKVTAHTLQRLRSQTFSSITERTSSTRNLVGAKPEQK